MKLWFEFLQQAAVSWDEAGVEDVARFVAWLRAPVANVIVLADGHGARRPATVNRYLAGGLRLLRPPCADRPGKLAAWAAALKMNLQIVARRNPHAFEVLPRRWVVERTPSAWISRHRRRAAAPRPPAPAAWPAGDPGRHVLVQDPRRQGISAGRARFVSAGACPHPVPAVQNTIPAVRGLISHRHSQPAWPAGASAISSRSKLLNSSAAPGQIPLQPPWLGQQHNER